MKEETECRKDVNRRASDVQYDPMCPKVFQWIKNLIELIKYEDKVKRKIGIPDFFVLLQRYSESKLIKLTF